MSDSRYNELAQLPLIFEYFRVRLWVIRDVSASNFRHDILIVNPSNFLGMPREKKKKTTRNLERFEVLYNSVQIEEFADIPTTDFCAYLRVRDPGRRSADKTQNLAQLGNSCVTPLRHSNT